MKYCRLECGIVVRVNDDGTTDWPYGPRQGTSLAGATAATQEEFKQQRDRAWQVIMEYQALLERLPDGAYDVALAAIGYAALTYDPSRGASLQTYVLRMMRFATRASVRQGADTGATELTEHQGAENFIGQIDANVDIYKYKAVLSREQWLLLLARYDSGLSLDAIAREFGFASRTTAKYKIEAALAVCRRLPP